MRNSARLLFFLLLLFAARFSVAQNVPSQYAGAIKGLTPQAQVDTIESLAFEVRKTDPSLSVALLKAAVRISVTNGLDTVEIQQRMNLNRQYRSKGENDSAMLQIDSALMVAREQDLVEWEEEVLSVKGVLQTRMGLYEEATASFVSGMELARANNDEEQMAQLNKNWAALLFYTTDFQGAIDRTKEALTIYTRMKDTASMATCVDNIGLYFSNMNRWDSAYVYQMKALSIFEAASDSSHLMTCYNNLGSTLIQLKNYPLAKTYLDRALRMAESREMNYQVMVTLSTLAELYKATGDRTGEQAAGLRVYDLALALENNFYALEGAEILAYSYYDESRFERSAFYFRITDSLRQIVFDSEKTEATEAAEKKYKAKEQQQQIELLEADNLARAAQNERDTIVKWAIGGVVVVLLIFSLVLVRNYNRKKRDNRLLQDQNEAIEQQKAEIEVKNEEITDSISYAKRIQNAVLPANEKLNALFPENFIYYRPRDIISGDFYWAAEGRNGVRFLAVADCTGHGVPGAMMSMLGTSILNRLIARKSIPGPGKMLDALHEELLTTLNATADSRQVSDGMDIALMMYDPEHKRVVIASADRPVFYVQNGALEILKPDKISIGSSLPKSPYTEHVLDINDGLSIFLFSDGITDQFGGWDRKKFMTKRLKDLVASSAALNVAEREALFTKTFDVWKAAMEQTDDMTLINVVFSVTGK